MQLAIDQKILEGVLQVSKVWKAELNVQKEMYSSAHMSMKNSLRKVIAQPNILDGETFFFYFTKAILWMKV